jgi:hypothetical protein
MMKKGKHDTSKKSSQVIHPGTGSGSRPSGGSIKTPTSEPKDKHTLGRAPAGALK